MGFPRQEYWSGLPFPSPGDFPDQGWNPGLLQVDLQVDSLQSESTGKPKQVINKYILKFIFKKRKKKKRCYGKTKANFLANPKLWIRSAATSTSRLSQTLLPLGRYNQFSSICTPCPYTSTLGQISNDMLDISASSHRLKHLRGGTTLHSFLSPSQCQPPSRCSVHAGSRLNSTTELKPVAPRKLVVYTRQFSTPYVNT